MKFLVADFCKVDKIFITHLVCDKHWLEKNQISPYSYSLYAPNLASLSLPSPCRCLHERGFGCHLSFIFCSFTDGAACCINLRKVHFGIFARQDNPLGSALVSGKYSLIRILRR